MTYRDVTVTLAVDEADPNAVTRVPTAVAQINDGNRVVVASDSLAVGALMQLGLTESEARDTVRASRGVRSPDLSGLTAP